ncbi:MAG TPA: YheC/YheD family protein, partial [Bacillales bacterium]|nr:YheC/YheD family protein [Bacillales bacterium]
MNIYYDCKSASWFHTGMKDEITIGGDNQIVRHQRACLDATRLDLQLKNGHVGPLIGIMTSRKENGSWAGNYSLFKELQKKLISLHGISFIFTQEGIQDDSINGFTYLPESQTWMKIKAPYPDLVYNRIPFRKAEQNEDFHHTLDIFKQKDIPFFNPCFIDKYDIHQLFKHHPILQKFLPKTEIIDNQTDVESFLEKYQSVYVKPAQSAKGKGIFRLRLNDQSEVHLDGISTNEKFASFQAFWNKWGTILNSKKYIIQ